MPKFNTKSKVYENKILFVFVETDDLNTEIKLI